MVEKGPQRTGIIAASREIPMLWNMVGVRGSEETKKFDVIQFRIKCHAGVRCCINASICTKRKKAFIVQVDGGLVKNVWWGMIWGVRSFSGVGPLRFIRFKVKSEKLCRDATFTFQQDLTPACTVNMSILTLMTMITLIQFHSHLTGQQAGLT